MEEENERIEGCTSFVPNQWRKTLCANCFRGLSAHSQSPIKEPQWYFARIEGPFTWEQMRHWYEAGYFKTPKLLVRDTRTSDFQLVEHRFPDLDQAFLPADPPSSGELAGGIAPSALPKDQKDVVIKQMRNYFSQGSDWYFVDAQDEVQGPFSSRHMADWYKAGYFWNTDLMVGHQGWDDYISLKDILDIACSTTLSAEELAMTDDEWFASADQDADAEHKEDASGEDDVIDQIVGDLSAIMDAISGPEAEHEQQYESTEQADDAPDWTVQQVQQYEASEAETPAETYEEVEQSYDQSYDQQASAEAWPEETHMETDMETREWTDTAADDGATGAGEGEGEEEEDEEEETPEWMYQDEEGAEQGPFTAAQMREWYRWNYFSADTFVRYVTCEEYAAVRTLFPDAVLDAQSMGDVAPGDPMWDETAARAFQGFDWYTTYLEMFGEGGSGAAE